MRTPKLSPARVHLAAFAAALSLALVACGDDASSSGGGGAGGASASTGAAPNGPGGVTTSGAGGGEPVSCGEPETHQGEGTYYDADGSGNCSFPATPGDLLVAAMNQTDYGASAACGACIRATGPSGEVTVRIVDRCPECPAGDVDFSPEAFEQIAELSAGRVDISWQWVPCEVDGPVRYHFKDGSNPFWTAVQVRNHRHRVASFAFRPAGGSEWIDVQRLEYNYFVYPEGMGDGPYDFRVTDVYGGVIEDTGVALGDDVERSGASQMPVCGAR
jgi:expansin